jgi:SulP family sulfate permease
LAIVGDVPSGLPHLELPQIRWDLMEQLVPTALIISLIGFVESISIANLIAAREGYQVSANRELAALGIANVATAVAGGYPVTGGLSRTAVNHQAGARTPMASMATALVVVATLLFLTPLFHFTPKAVLAALVVVSVAGLVNYRDLAQLWIVCRSDAWTLVLTFCITLLFGVEIGIVCGVTIALGLLIKRSAHPRIVEVGLVETDGAFRDITRFSEARRFPGVLIFRVDAELYFANMRFVEDRLRVMLVDRDIQWVIFDLSSVNDMDAVAALTLKDWIGLYEQKGISFLFAGMKGPVKDLVKRAGWLDHHARQVSLQNVLSEIGVMNLQ